MDRRRKTELSDREKQLVRLAAAGHTDSSIAHELGISEATVSTYWGRVRIKVGPFSRPELIATLIREELETVVNDLKYQNRQLVEELQKATGQEWGEPESNFYRKLVLEAADAILVVDENGSIETANEEAAKMFGYEREELEGKILHTLIPDRYKLNHIAHRKEYMANPQKRRMAEHIGARGLRKDGTELDVAATLTPIESSSGMRVMCIVRQVLEPMSD